MSETTIDSSVAVQNLPISDAPEVNPPVILRESDSPVSPADLAESKEILTVPSRAFQEAESVSQGILLGRAREVTPLLRENEDKTIDKTNLPDWAQKLDDKSLKTLSFLHGIRNIPEGVLQETANIQAPDEAQDMYVLFDNANDSYDLILENNPDMGSGQMKLRLTGLKSRTGNTLTFVTDYDQHDEVTLTTEQFTTLFSYAQRENMLTVFEGKTHDVAQAYFDNLTTPENLNVDRDTMNEAVKNSGQISTESLIQSLSSVEPVAGDDPEAQARHKKRDELIQKLQNHSVATAQDMAEVMSFHTPDEIQKTITDYKSKINDKLDTLGQLRHQRAMAAENNDSAQLQVLDNQMRLAQEEINSLRADITQQEKAQEFFNNPKNLVDFFSKIQAGEISPEMGQQINELISQGEIPDALMKMAEAKIATLDESAKEVIRQKMNLDKGVELTLAAVGGTALLLLMMMMSAMKE